MSDRLPSGWTWATPPNLASPERNSLSIGPFGSNLKVSDYSDDGVPLVFVRNIRAESFGDNDPKFVSKDKATQLAAHEVDPGDVLITKMGEPPGDSALYPLSRPMGIITADCIRWRIDPQVGDARYFVYATRSPEVREQILGITRGVAQRKVSLSRFKSVRYRLAPLPEQRRIVEAIESYFTRLDDAVATLERVQRNLKRYRASVLKAAVEGRLVPTEAELARAEGRDYEPASVLLERILAERRRRWEEAELAKMQAKGKTPKDDRWKAKYKEPIDPDLAGAPSLPEGWTWTSLEAVTCAARVICYGILMPKEDVPDGVPYVKVRDMRSGVLDVSALQRTSPAIAAKYPRSVLRCGDLLLAIRGTYGRVVDVPAELDGGNITQDSARLDILPGVNRRYAKWMLLGDDTQRHFKRIARGVAVKGVNIGDVRTTPVPLPPLAEQDRIVQGIEDLLSIEESHESALAANQVRLGRLRQAILRWAFEGRLVDQDPTDEPASRLLERIHAERESANGQPRRSPRRPSARSPKA